MSSQESLENQLQHTRRHLDLMMSLSLASTEPGDLGFFLRRSLEVIARANNWAIGQYWKTDPKEQVIVCTDYYYSSAVVSKFRQDSLDRRVSKGVGLPGRIWSNGFPLFVPSVATETGLHFPRKESAVECGITSGYGFPIKNGPFVIGIYEFFSFEPMSITDQDNLFYDKLGGYLATLIAQKETEELAKDYQVFNMECLNHAYTAFIAIDESSLITEWTTRTTALFGWTKDEVIGKPLAEIIIPERYRNAHMKGLFHYMATSEGPVLDKRVRAPALHKDGHEIPIELLIFPIQSQKKRRFGAYIVDCSKAAEPAHITLE